MTTQANDNAQMTVPELLKELELCTGQFPKRAVQQAIEQQEAVTPHLLGVLEELAASPASFVERQDYMLHIFAMYLLAQFREKRAYRPLVTIVSAPGDIPDRLLGDTLTEGLTQLLGSVYDGDPRPLYGLVEDANVEGYVRSAAIDTFLVLWSSGQMSRDEVVAYYRSLFHGKLEKRGSPAWEGLVSAVADLRVPELLEEVREAFANDLVDPMFAGFGEIERDILGPPRPLRATASSRTPYRRWTRGTASTAKNWQQVGRRSCPERPFPQRLPPRMPLRFIARK
jgi:hypothetical protein